MDLFEKISRRKGALGQYRKDAHGYFTFPKLEGEIGPHMVFRGKKVLNWSLNNYIGLANHPEVRKADAEAARDWGLAYPMGARMMSGQTSRHEELEQKLAEFVGKPSAYLLNYGYQGMLSIIDALVDRNDVIVYDSDSHACIMDGLRLHFGKRFVYPHNNMENLEKQLERANRLTEKTGGAILVITEGVFGMVGDLGKLDQIVEKKKRFHFTLLVDDAHGFGTMGSTGAGTGEHFGVQDQVDLYFSTFAKSMAGIGAFVAGPEPVIQYLMYEMRSQIFAKSLPMPMVIGALKRLELLKTEPALRENLWKIVRALQDGLKKSGLNIGSCESPVTPVFLNGTPEEASNVILDLRENYSLFCSGVIYPVVPRGIILLRLIPTAAHTMEDVEYTVKAFSEVQKKLAAGKYSREKMAQI
ncbi:MAG TPA: aminotransferase class I/II-fold pyridoxal phosphate-dependent enzyme [Bacteroidetes bacterium]|nr:aminotransferase class I/II-fold pyridoxal phosphate-dependent enzyme [Bacteroidota bacterium]